ncbi:Wadjet anti-phage system protein JetD domain-containing protein [Herbiconiux sp. YIM B11900]|uniref:Wadjet anti-phage system protein JetD domain-containing protein n=1 Tax=Herbiconiux sp. YIM B11900 TaxID=3404131 RepID=UPI003F863F4C
MLRVTGLHPTIELLARFGHDALSARVIRSHDIGLRMFEAGAETDPAAIRALEKHLDEDVVVALDAVVWLRTHSDLSGWTSRQLPIPGADTKWADSHDTLIRRLTRRRVGEETRERPAVVHLSYADPYYIASGGRRHDAWTAGDSHRLAYEPRIVLVVENRDCRLGFPEFAGTVVVEGEGKAAAKLAEIDWLVRAERIRLPALTPDEEYCYALLATSGEVAVRRIEQERIPLADAAEALRAALGG